VPAYPERLIRRSPAGIVKEPSHRPVVIVFYDDDSKAAALQAADILPTLVEFQRDVDIVAIDMNRRAERSQDEQWVVKTYYFEIMPTTVVLSPRRAPVRLALQRIAAESLKIHIQDALARR
jgi:hypothetical protein